VRQTLQRAVDFRRGHELSFFDDAHGRVILAYVGQAFPPVAAASRQRRINTEVFKQA
jgi:hypothetical protein